MKILYNLYGQWDGAISNVRNGTFVCAECFKEEDVYRLVTFPCFSCRVRCHASCLTYDNHFKCSSCLQEL